VSTSLDRSPDHNGWYNHAVDWTTTGSDSTSNIDSCSSGTYSTPDGTGLTVSGTCTDNAGNTSSPAASAAFKYDATAPTVSVTGVTNGATYTLGSVPTAGCSTTDSTSNVQTAASLSISGGPVGSVTATCSGAIDNAGNTNSASATYSVVYNFTGFFQPVDNAPTCNSVKAGQAIPVKFSLHGYQGLDIFASGSPSVASGTCTGAPLDAVETTVTAGNSSLSYDWISDQYTYVWKTDKAWAGKAMRLTVTFADGTTQYARFAFTK
jgi:hypothetical protein